MTGGSQHWLNRTGATGPQGDPGPAGPGFSNQQYAENLVQFDTSSAAFGQVVSITTPALPAGTYRIGQVFQYTGSTGSTVGESRIEIDNTTTIDLETLDVASAGERKTYADFTQVVLAAGVHTIDLDVRKSAGSGTFSVDDAKLEIWRVA